MEKSNSDDKSVVSLLSTTARMDNNGDVDADLRMMLVGFDLAYQFDRGLDLSGMDISSVADTGFSPKHGGAALVAQKPIASAAAALKSAVDNGTSPGVRSSLAGGPKDDSATTNRYSNEVLYMESKEISRTMKMVSGLRQTIAMGWSLPKNCKSLLNQLDSEVKKLEEFLVYNVHQRDLIFPEVAERDAAIIGLEGGISFASVSTPNSSNQYNVNNGRDELLDTGEHEDVPDFEDSPY